jgi:hypothetical protein
VRCARAASRLETLGFRQVYRYQPGKADWFAAGLPREGREAYTPRVADIARRDVPTCRIDERVDAVHDRMREGAQGKGGTNLAALRQSYDLLIMKVLSLLQDSDAALARDIVTSREGIWSLLADPAKFATLS